MQMPNVFVVPPEEDETPAWCFFDADNPATLSQVITQPEPSATSNSLAHPDAYMSIYDSSNMANPTSSWNSDNVSVVDALISDDYAAQDMESDTESEYDGDDPDSPDSMHPTARQAVRSPPNPADDSDVIEIVKVGRRSGMPEPEHMQSGTTRSQLRRSSTLKSKASKVFRSLKSTLRSKSKARELPPLPPMPVKPEPARQVDAADPPKSPTLSRRGSKALSKLFTAPSLKSQKSRASLDDRPPFSPTDSCPAPSSPPEEAPSRSLPRRPSVYSAFGIDDVRARAASPTPTIATSKSTKRRISVTLKSLFSFSPAQPMPAQPPNIPCDSGRTTPTTQSTASTPPSVMSSVLTSGPQTPTSSDVNSVRLIGTKDASSDIALESAFENNFYLGPGLGLSLDLDSNVGPSVTPRNSLANSVDEWESVTPKQSRQMDGDISFEMRLDSLHFDSISFDADQFALQLEDDD